MHSRFLLLAAFLGGALAHPQGGDSHSSEYTVVSSSMQYPPSSTFYRTISTVSYYSTSVYHPHPHPTGECGDECGGVCGDGIVQPPYEQCDLGPAKNGASNSGCSKDCKKVPYCGDGVVNQPGETC